ncbi:MAG: winged helix-turn-helix transcriptional regulator [Steroidobacteraceae bacterium]|jgi:MarR family transcriptional regulator for hemolysin|nr:winged helix-turn-helix transcriptional regulator [Steroidobacteraceae bacterium]
MKMTLPHQEIGQVLLRLTQDFHRRLQADLEARGIASIRARHRSVFLHLARDGVSRSVDLAAATGVRPPSMMKTVQELETLGFVTRVPDPVDSRAKLISFTPAGRRLIRELARSTEAVWEEYARIAGEALVARLFNDMEMLLARADEERPP